MKFVYPDINHVFDTEIGKVNSLVIENQKVFSEIITDISTQIEGFDGKCVLSEENKILTFSKNADLLTQFVPFDLNRKTLVNKAASALEQAAVSGEYFQKTAEILSQLEAYLFEISANFSCDISFSKISAASIIKASGFEFKNDYDTLCEKSSITLNLLRNLIGKNCFLQ